MSNSNSNMTSPYQVLDRDSIIEEIQPLALDIFASIRCEGNQKTPEKVENYIKNAINLQKDTSGFEYFKGLLMAEIVLETLREFKKDPEEFKKDPGYIAQRSAIKGALKAAEGFLTLMGYRISGKEILGDEDPWGFIPKISSRVHDLAPTHAQL